MLLLLSLQLVEILIQPVVALLPEAAIGLGPLGDVFQRLGPQAAGAPLSVAAARDESGTLENVEVLRDRRLRDRERCGELGNGGLTRGEPGEDRPPGRVGEGCEAGV